MRFLPLLIIAGCASTPRQPTPAPRPAAPPTARVAAAITAWGEALRRDDAAAFATASDHLGMFAFAYVLTKRAASEVEGGAEAVETTVAGNVAYWVLSSLWPGLFPPTDALLVAVPLGPLGPALVDAGLATRTASGAPITVVPVPHAKQRLDDAAERHRARLRERQAWTCRPAAIEHTVAPTEPALVRAAAISTFIFASWHAGLEGMWIVRAECATGTAMFVVTGHANGQRVLLSAIPAG